MRNKIHLRQLTGITKARRKWYVSFFLIGAVIVLGCAIGIYIGFPHPPVQAINRTRVLLSEARRSEAWRYTPGLLREAENCFMLVQSEWRKQNQKIFLNRDFKVLLSLNNIALQQALITHQRTKEIKDSLKILLKIKIELMSQKIDSMQAVIQNFPAQKLTRSKFTKGSLFILESRLAYERGNYQEANQKLARTEEYLGEVYQKINDRLIEYIKELPKWRSWATEVIELSKTNKSTVIMIDKMARTCQVYLAGELKAVYSAEFGANWIGHKIFRGDLATPEGKYFIKEKKDLGQSKYYKALELDYPTPEDRENFISRKKSGKLPKDAHIGGSIEIHGEGGKGFNWTEGCIALRNEDMDKLFQMTFVGTPILIVGTLNGLQ
ncbi:MAG: L,D-transpeptidase [bacterium]|nr:MAG: L,D-transpeptidase [bacterium]